MLPPSLNGTDLVYDFYSLGKDKIVSLKKKKYDFQSESNFPRNEADFVGSSHGWIISFENGSENSNLILTNPLTATNKKLPSPYHLPLPYSHIENVVVSSPDPDDDKHCRAVMRFDGGKLAFCCPKNSVKWTPFGDGHRYCSTVFSSTQKLFFCLTKENGVEAWDLNNLKSPVKIPMKGMADKFPYQPPWKLTMYLAVADVSDDLYLVRRTTRNDVAPDGSDMEFVHFGELAIQTRLPYKTVQFDVYKYDKKSRDWEHMDRTLDGMAIFVGINHGFALRAADYPNLKSDAVYFTDVRDCYKKWGHDVGIFNYRNGTFSPCYYPCDCDYESGRSIKKVLPPLWYTSYIYDRTYRDYEDYLINKLI